MLAAAGHLDMNDNPPFPAGMDGVFCVASSNGDGKASKFNPRFADKDVEKFAALGENVKVSCLRKGNSVGTLHNTTETRSGSSVAVAVAASIKFRPLPTGHPYQWTTINFKHDIIMQETLLHPTLL